MCRNPVKFFSVGRKWCPAVIIYYFFCFVVYDEPIFLSSFDLHLRGTQSSGVNCARRSGADDLASTLTTPEQIEIFFTLQKKMKYYFAYDYDSVDGHTGTLVNAHAVHEIGSTFGRLSFIVLGGRALLWIGPVDVLNALNCYWTHNNSKCNNSSVLNDTNKGSSKGRTIDCCDPSITLIHLFNRSSAKMSDSMHELYNNIRKWKI